MTRDAAIEYLKTKVKEDEPVFVLRGQDRVAEKTIRQWAQNARDAGTGHEKFEEAMTCALAMGRWRAANGGGKVPD